MIEKAIWLRKLREERYNVEIIVNAAKFMSSDFSLAQGLWKRAIALEPKNERLSLYFAWFLRRNAKNRIRMKSALIAIQDALRKTKDPKFKFYLYPDIAEIAFAAGELKIAKAAAKKAVALAAKFDKNWSTGNALHNGNCILGRIALQKGDIDERLQSCSEVIKTSNCSGSKRV